MNQTDGAIALGDVVSGLEPSEILDVQRIAPFGSKTLVEGYGMEGSAPTLRIIQDPIPKLNPEMLYWQVQFAAEERD